MIRRLFALAVLAWVLGFIVFVVTLPSPAGDQRTDAIVVPTGGQGRIARGLQLLGEGKAKRMLITGVDRSVRPHELATMNGVSTALFACCVDIGHEAVDTRSNADETVAWLRRRGYRSIRLVTTDWHMPRARFELRRIVGGSVTILPDAVGSNPELPVLLREYHKYVLRRIAVLVGL